jgi:hypothetical protein
MDEQSTLKEVCVACISTVEGPPLTDEMRAIMKENSAALEEMLTSKPRRLYWRALGSN